MIRLWSLSFQQQRLWRIDPAANYGPLDKAARGRIDLDKISEHWQDMCRVAVSMHRGEVSGHEVTRMMDITRGEGRCSVVG